MKRNKTILAHRGIEKEFATLNDACEAVGLRHQTVRNYLSRNKTNRYQSPDGKIVIKVEK